MTSIHSRIPMIVLLIASALSLQGCLLTRIQTLQEQACSFDQNFELSNDGTRITFLQPTLRYDDVTFLVGVSPRLSKLTGNRYQGRYSIRKIGDPTFADIPVLLEFVKRDQQLLLAAASIDTALLSSLSPADLPMATQEACTTSLPRWSTRLEVELPDFDSSALLGKKAIGELVGPPIAIRDNGNTLNYQFALKGAEGEELIATLQLEYSPDDDTLQRTRTQFYHYLTGTDFVAGTAWATITL